MKAIPILACCALLLGGCQSLLREGSADIAGIAGASLSDAITDNGAVTAGIGLGVRSLAAAGLGYAERRAQGAEQDIIAKAAGQIGVGGVASWGIRQNLPIQPSRAGRVTVVREIDALGRACREIVFSVSSDVKEEPDRAFYTAAVCRNGDTWKWASAEPATARWGALQ